MDWRLSMAKHSTKQCTLDNINDSCTGFGATGEVGEVKEVKEVGEVGEVAEVVEACE